MCDCVNVDKWCEGAHNDSRFEKMKRIKVGDWCYLLKCNDCGQLWQVDAYDKFAHGLAIKFFETEEKWLPIPDKEIRKEIITANYGGISEKECSWHGCKNKALANLILCTDHAYENGIRW